MTEFDRDGLVYEKGGVKVIAFEVDHGDVIKPCFGYRIEYSGRVAVFSSDTRYNHNVIKYGKGADLLVERVLDAVRRTLALNAKAFRQHAVLGLHRHALDLVPAEQLVEDEGRTIGHQGRGDRGLGRKNGEVVVGPDHRTFDEQTVDAARILDRIGQSAARLEV